MTAALDISGKTTVLAGMARRHPGAYIDNLETVMETVTLDGVAVPLTRNDGGRRTCYVCCPSAAYSDYALSELRHFDAHPALRTGLGGLVRGASPLLAMSGVDRHVQVNNWLLATNPLPQISATALATVTRDLIGRFPHHAVVWRSLNDLSDAAKLTVFRDDGYALFPARQVYLFDCRTSAPAVHRDERRDQALLAQDDYTSIGPDEFGVGDYARMSELYGMLYLQKYTTLNPHYGAEFIAAAHREGLLVFHGLRGRKGLDGVIGFFDMDDTMTAPLVGYDTTRPQELGLYRRLMAIGLRRARSHRMLFNMSAGAAGFKRNRGAVPAIEYAAIYSRHLSLSRRIGFAAMQRLLSAVGPALLRDFAL